MYVQGESLKIVANLSRYRFFDSPAANFISGILLMAGEIVMDVQGVKPKDHD